MPAERYVTLEDLRGALPQMRLDAASKPSEAQSLTFIAAVENYVDAALKGAGYAVPVVAAEALPIVREIVLHGVIARVLRATNLGVRDPEATGAAAEQREFEKKVTQLIDPHDPHTLPGVAVVKVDTYAGQPEPVVRGNVPDEDAAFQRGQVF